MDQSRKHNPDLTDNARALRKNMTKEERHLWYDFLRTYPVRFLRQKVIDRYIADFYCHDARLVMIPNDTHCYDHHLDQVLEAVTSFVKDCESGR